MINANELRIGNWIWDDENKPVKVEYITSERYVDWEGDARVAVKFSFSKDDRIWESEFINPIPLTPEILEKAGFVNNHSNEYWSFFVFGNGWYISQWVADNPVGGFEEKGVFYYSDSYIPVRYLHDLQNLFFALNRKELEINL